VVLGIYTEVSLWSLQDENSVILHGKTVIKTRLLE
jgi:hypothetical protein